MMIIDLHISAGITGIEMHMTSCNQRMVLASGLLTFLRAEEAEASNPNESPLPRSSHEVESWHSGESEIF